MRSSVLLIVRTLVIVGLAALLLPGCPIAPPPDTGEADTDQTDVAGTDSTGEGDDRTDAGETDSGDGGEAPAEDPEPVGLAGITAAHNYWRSRVGVLPLQWNAELAASAQAYADTLATSHDPNRSPDAGFSSVGENIFYGYPASNITAAGAVENWASERFDYDFGTPFGSTGGAVVGHYTQIVWSTTTDIGCGYAEGFLSSLGRTGAVVVCRYGPAGNYYGQFPYPESTGNDLDLDNDDVLQIDDADDTDRTVQ